MGQDKITITVMNGAEDGRVFTTDKTPIMLGRHPDDDVYLPYDTRCSRRHARLTKEGSSYYIDDVGPQGKGSTNGTWIGGEKPIEEKTLVSSGDRIVLGSIDIKLEIKLDEAEQDDGTRI